MNTTPQENIKNWRQEIREVGKQFFEIQDMLQMGFLKMPPQDLERMKAKVKELGKLNAEINKLSKELKDVEDITPLIKEIRKNRIERVRAARAIRKVEKEREEQQRQKEIAEKKKNTPYFLGKGFSKGLNYDNQDEAKLQELDLPIVNNVTELSEATKLTREQILWLSYHREAASLDHYHRFQIPKKKGGFRSISSPKTTMRKAQMWIMKMILNKIPLHEAAMAFQAGKSVVDNAQAHQKQKVLVRMDLKDFFPSIKYHRVKGLFQSFGYNDGMSAIFAMICTDAFRVNAKLGEESYFVALSDRYLPQGACTSPALSNIICRRMDNRLQKFAKSIDWVYTRYADDMIFSSAEKSDKLGSVLGLTQKVIQEESFEINPEKTLVMRQSQRQMVTGVVVNHEVPRISRRDMKNFRAFCHQYELKGETEMSKKLGKNATQYSKGYLSFMQMVNPEQAQKFKEKYAWL